MVKTPRTRHSKSSREPVTIDLSPEEVSRLKAEEDAAAASDAMSADETMTPDSVPDPVVETTPSLDEVLTPPESQSSFDSDTAPREDFGRKNETRAAAPVRQRTGGSHLLSGVAGGVVALALAGGLHFAGLLPGSRSVLEDHAPAIAALEAQIASLRQQVANAGANAPEAALTGRVGEAEQQIAALGETVQTLRDDIANAASAGGAVPVDLAPIEERLAALETSVSEMQQGAGSEPADLTQLNSEMATLRDELGAAREAQGAVSARVDALESSQGAMSNRLDEQADAPSTAVIIAVSSLKAALDRGTSYATELDTLAALSPDATQLEGLRAYAQSGVATRTALAAEADAAANAMIAATQPVSPDAGITDKLWASAMGLVQVRPVGMVEGNGVPEIAARIDAAVGAGDYERALTEYEGLPEAAKAAGKSFIDRVRARHEADALVDQALASALRSQG
jgi:hypothetical protein